MSRSDDPRSVEELETLAPSAGPEATRRSPPSRPRVGRPARTSTQGGRSRVKSLLQIVAALVLGALLGGGVGWQVHSASRPATRRDLPMQVSQRVVVPNVIGMTPWDAQAVLARWGLAGSVDTYLTQQSRVFAQEPSAGQEVAVGTIVGIRTRAPQQIGPSTSPSPVRAPSRSYRYCLSSPLAGQLFYTPGPALLGGGQVRGHVVGFPGNDYVEADLLGSTVTPVHVLGTVGFTTNSTGAQDLTEPAAIDPSATVSHITFRAYTRRTNDLRPYGPPAEPC